MRIFLSVSCILLSVAYASAGRPSASYLPPSYAPVGAAGSSQYPRYHGVNSVAPSRPLHHAAAISSPAAAHHSAQYGHNSAAAQIPILRNDYTNDGNGNYNFGYETGNGIKHNERGELQGGWPSGSLNVEGSYSYTGDDGKVYSVNYKADSNGFHAEGDHLPTPPPIPKEIQETLHLHQRGNAGGSHSNYAAGGVGGYPAGGHYASTGSHHSPAATYLPPSPYGRRL